MESKSDLLDIVVSQLEARQGYLTRLADETGISYDTLLRIKNRENDPGYSKVQLLARHLGIVSAYAVPREPTFCSDQ
jgi:transcriptional regulator with XRE-family HTH domain